MKAKASIIRMAMRPPDDRPRMMKVYDESESFYNKDGHAPAGR